MKHFFYFCLTLLALFGCSKSQSHYIGEKYLGVKYINDPLGEEKAPDTDPLIRFDAFDCVTFVETSLADGDVEKLTKIRYKNGEINFLNRNHFASSDWMQNNKDIVKNVSADYGKTAVRTAIIDKQNWLKKTHNMDVQVPKQRIDIEYIPYADITDILPKEPLIVLFVVDNPKIIDKIGSDLVVLHMGFLLPNGKLRHASRQYGRVLDVDFKEYVQERAKNRKNIGIALLEIIK